MTAALALRAPQLRVPDFTPEHVIALDFETYWDADYTLRKLTTWDYVVDERFETIGVAVYDGEDVVWMEHEEFAAWAKTIDWSKCAVLGHHLHFDSLILSYRYDVHPAVHLCTMSMARAFGIDGGVSLENLGKHFGVGNKGHEVEVTKGMHRRDFTPEQYARYGGYSCNDILLTDGIYNAMIEQGFPEEELYSISSTIKMFTEPELVIDEPLLTQYLFDEQQRKAGLLARIEKDRSLVLSNDKFALQLQELGVEPQKKVSLVRTKKLRTVKSDAPAVMTWAFAKNDSFMQELLEHEEDEVRWLAEARVAVKSTINETRTQRFLRMGKNGQPMPVHLLWYGAHTGRWSASGKTNFQNLQRTNKKDPSKGVLRKALLAPDGFQFIAADSGQIEARITAWLAEHDDLVAAFARGEDVYSAFASDVYGRHVDRKKNPADELPGMVGKVCLVGETPVLTERGWIPLEQVRQTDRVWDGVEWAQHQGLLDQGVKEVWTMHGLAMTPDHEIQTERGWAAWSEVLESPFLFQSALRSARLPSCGGNARWMPAESLQDGSRALGASVAGKDSLTDKTYSRAEHVAVTRARSVRLAISATGSTKPPWQTMNRGAGFLIGLTRAFLVATTRTIRALFTMVIEELRCATYGEEIKRLFSSTCSRFPGGTIPSWSLIGPTTTGITNQETYDSFPGEKTSATSAKSRRCNNESLISKRRTRVFDLLAAGPRKRFTVLSSKGPVVVHNCVLSLGYGLGYFKLAENFLRGVSAAPIQFDIDMALQMGVDLNKWYQDEAKVERVRNEMVSRLPIEQLMVHVAVCDYLVKKYRRVNKPITDLWKTMEQVLEAMCEDDADYTFGPNGCLRVVRHGIVLPNGLTLHYPGLKYGDEDGREGFTYLAKYGKKRVHTYGGAMTENVVQALARIVINQQMLHITAVTGYEPKLCTHDELAYIAPTPAAPWLLYQAQEAMKIPPVWAAGLPLSVEGGHATSYGACK